ncbi:NUDIX domain-containing protein [Clostridium sp. C8-1-8]|uniref:NUDIX hydrolase n=1 Tax=Clostridium sp. C8-1-8 TaxID=2698831 RepID=UPI00136D27B7|nr:NUDIX domain-containing protein [Clostridium sp. C8-1-8]
MPIITWHSGNVPSNIEVTQVYGIVFTKDGRILLRIENGQYQLTGGKPETSDGDMEATLKREMLEESNVIISKAYIVGYQLVEEEDGSEPYAQVRMTAMIENIGEQQPDIDNGRIYGRFLTTPTKAANLLNWGDVGNKQIFEATEIAKQRFKINLFSDDDTLIDSEIN